MSGVTRVGLMAEFAEPDAAVAVARTLRQDGIKRFEVYSPLPLEEMNALIDHGPVVWLALIMFGGAVAGGILGFLMQYLIAVVFYPINIGGRPLDSWPAFVPCAWEICALGAVYVGFAAFLIFCRLPQLYHPIFDAPRFGRASQDRTFLYVARDDPRFDADRIAACFRSHHALSVAEIAA